MRDELADQSWLNEIPDCPCYILSDGAGGWKVPGDGNDWETPGPPFCCHPGAANCVRGTRPRSGWEFGCSSGQQCCYNQTGDLITGGAGAGTPDFYSPITGPGRCKIQHWWRDVRPYHKCVEAGLLSEYLRARPPNNGNNCPKIVVN